MVRRGGVVVANLINFLYSLRRNMKPFSKKSPGVPLQAFLLKLGTIVISDVDFVHTNFFENRISHSRNFASHFFFVVSYIF